MKLREFLKRLTKEGCYLKRHGGNHDLYVNPKTGKVVPVPRHKEIKNTLAKGIRRQLGLD